MQVGLPQRALAAALVAALAATACSSSRDPNAPTRPLPSWSGHAVEVFDDTIEPAAVGLDYDRGYAPRADPLLRERAQLADAVVRVRVKTVTVKADGPDAVYQLGLRSVEKLGGSHPPPEDFDVVITKASESYGIMKSLESRLVGQAFIAFVREFVRSDGDREFHFHIAPDSPAVKLAVSDAIALDELKK